LPIFNGVSRNSCRTRQPGYAQNPSLTSQIQFASTPKGPSLMSHANSSREALAITALLSGFPASETIDQAARFHAFRMAIDGVSIEAVERAVRAFLTGKVKEHTRAFAPSSAEFSEQCRYQQAIIDAETRPRIETKPPVDDAPRVDPRKLVVLKNALQGDNRARATLRRWYPDIKIPDVPERKESAE
jgi:hypothetical protein